MPRKIRGGTIETKLSEVWVINTSTISNNAQDKIHQKYNGQRVEFISGEKLTDLVDKYASYFWYDISADVGSYLQALLKKLEQQEGELSILNGMGCNDFYIPPEIQEFEKNRYIKNNRPSKPRFVNLVDEIIKSKVNFLEGEMGFGKSKTVRNIAKYYCAPDRYKQNPVIPIFNTFRNLSENGKTLSSLLEETAKPFFDPASHPQSKFLFIIDGVDEAVGKCDKWADKLNALTHEVKSNEQYYILFTSRPLRLIDEQVTIYAGANRYLLRSLSMHKLVAFIQKACENLSLPKRLFEDLQKSELFKKLPQSPIAAALLSRLLAQNSNDLPSNLTELYSKSVENLLGRWDISKGGCTEKEYKDAEQVSMDLADYIVSNQLIYISETEARQRITSWHSQRNTSTNLEVLIERVFEKSGLFSVDQDNGVVSFRHRSFGEFLYALNCYKKHKLLPVDKSFNSYWVSIQFFQTGLLGDCEEHLRQLLEYHPTSEIELWLKTLMMPDYFLAGYQTPYGIVEDNLYKLFIDAANLYERAKKGETKTKLSELPEMHLLWVFQRLIRNSFEYDYFRRAITPTILKIEQEILPTETKLVALFFAASFAAELNDASGFEFLIKTYGAEKLPLPISLAIHLEQNTNKDFAKLSLIKEHERKLQTMLKSENKPAIAIANSQLMKDLFEKPVRTRLPQKKNSKS